MTNRIISAIANPWVRRALCVAAVLALSIPGIPAWAADRIAVRVGDHGEFSRVVFDWSERIEYSVDQSDDAVIITFELAGDFDLHRLLEDPPPMVVGARAVTGGDGTSVRIDLAQPLLLRHFYNGPKIVLDFMEAPVDREVAETPPTPAAETADPVTVASTAAPDTGTAVPAAAEEATPADTVAPAADRTPAPDRTPTVPAEAEWRPALTAEPLDGGGVRLTVPWRSEVPAAVFRRAQYVWIVFGETASADLSRLSAGGRSPIGAVTQVNSTSGMVLRIDAGANRFAEARHSGLGWRIDLTSEPKAPSTPLEITRRTEEGNGARLFIPVTTAGAAIEFIDPEVGDLVIAVPLMHQGYGVMDERRYVEFHVLASVQGVAVVPQSDTVYVTPGREGITISGSETLGASSRADMVAANGTKAPPEIFETQGGTPERRASRLIDFEAWRRGPRSDYPIQHKALLRAFSTIGGASRNQARDDLARFYVGHGRSAEALGILEVMDADDALVRDRPGFLALRGVARVQMVRYREALTDLENIRLAGDPHILLWRSLAAEGLGQDSEAIGFFRRGQDVLWEYTEYDQAPFRLAAARAALAEGDDDLARAQLTELSMADLPRRFSSEVELLRGHMYEVHNEDRNALASYERTIAADYRPTMARARLARTDVLLRIGEIDRGQAIEDLERLRFAWRGGEFEFKLMDRLGHLHIESNNYRAGLTAIRSAITHFGKSDATRAMAKEMSVVFSRLFIDGEADKLSAVNALALYYDFRELTPIGAAGDNMIRKLSERLVSVDLLTRAAELLEHQITFRLNGVPQAQVAARLAVIYLLNDKPAEVIDILRKTQQPRLPEDIVIRRRHLEVQAMTNLGRHDEALELLEGDDSAEAVALRADIYWNAGLWADVAQSARDRLDARAASAGALEQAERFLVLRLVVALALDDDAEGLAGVRREYGDLMYNGPFYRSFDVVTSKVDFDGLELRDLVGQLADVNIFQEFLANYRGEMSGPVFSSLN